eukprot:CAMPEP_0181173034 /NCGR_PEP_ID=MMETSP1096-20121128/2772_1 /TAXON_ID=156174 ORGANISM="Chrysochromulina ericina, Strain CCMP281" /NCGR_SAMPLE_ID=MMETSP1096 /ASSEMBLY_ACC=CAM_ASM_000453 /LENGTH=203 /DNA_ID=CAMNT_0023260811 /DNA_START=106 /DNA_END=715 /DNA_ORIENTATION=+
MAPQSNATFVFVVMDRRVRGQADCRRGANFARWRLWAASPALALHREARPCEVIPRKRGGVEVSAAVPVVNADAADGRCTRWPMTAGFEALQSGGRQGIDAKGAFLRGLPFGARAVRTRFVWGERGRSGQRDGSDSAQLANAEGMGAAVTDGSDPAGLRGWMQLSRDGSDPAELRGWMQLSRDGSDPAELRGWMQLSRDGSDP